MSEKLSNKIRIGYGLGQLSEGIAYNFFYFYYTFFLITIVGIKPGVAGTLSAFAVFWDAITDPYVGFLSDKSTSELGKRRSFIKKAAVPLGIIIFLLFTKPPFEGPILIAYLFVINILFWVFFTFCDVSWITLGNEITNDFDEKSILRAISTGFLTLGQLVSVGLTLIIVDFFYKYTHSKAIAWSICAGILGIITFLGFMFSFWTTKGLDKPANLETVETKFSPLKLFKNCLNVKGFKSLFSLSIIVTITSGIFASGLIFYLTIIYNMSNEGISLLNIIAAIGCFVFTYFVGYLATKFDKRTVASGCFLIASIGLLVGWILPFTSIAMMVILVSVNAGITCFWTVVFSLLGDVTEIESYKNGDKHTGAISSFVSFGTKIGTAFGMWFIGQGLNYINYSENITVNNVIMKSFNNIFVLPLSIVFALAFVCMMIYPYSRKRYNEDKVKYLNR